tara:strand:+ start:6791 stop:7213 length:423 start_codon:yes stop_codon:yes gene_type:complete
MKNVRHVNAVYNGKKHRFELQRGHIAAFELALQGSAYAALQRFVNGEWTFRDVELTLSFSYDGLSETDAKIARMVREMDSMGLTGSPMMHRTDFTVTKVLRDKGPAPYAELAANILAAALMGLSEEDAVFDDGSLGEAAA